MGTRPSSSLLAEACQQWGVSMWAHHDHRVASHAEEVKRHHVERAAAVGGDPCARGAAQHMHEVIPEPTRRYVFIMLE